MNNNLFVRAILFVAIGVACSPALADEGGKTSEPVTHTVMFWLKDGTAQTTVDEMIEAVQEFEKLPMVDQVFVGQPIASDRDVVDSSFGLGFTLTFKDEAALKQYEEDPEHLKISRERLLPHVVRGVVYDYR